PQREDMSKLVDADQDDEADGKCPGSLKKAVDNDTQRARAEKQPQAIPPAPRDDEARKGIMPARCGRGLRRHRLQARRTKWLRGWRAEYRLWRSLTCAQLPVIVRVGILGR